VIGCKVGVASWLEERQSEEAVVKTGGDVQCEEDAVLKKGDAARAESSVDETVGSGVGAVSWLVKERGAEVSTEGGGMRCDKEIALERTEEGGEKTAINEGGDIRCAEEVILEESEEEAEHGVDRIVGSGVWVVDWQVEEKKMGIPDTGEDVQRDENVALERTEEGDMLRDMEGVGQRGVEDKGTKKSDKKRSKIREGQKTSKLRGKLTKKDKRQLLQGMDKVFSRGNRLRRRHRWKRHQQIVEDLEK